MKRNFLILLVLLGLVACGSAPPVPTDHFYRLVLPRDTEKQQLYGGVIYVGNFIADGLYNDRAVLFVNDKEGRELQQHHYHFWITSPPHLLQDYLVDYLRQTGASSMILAGPSTKGGIKISGKIQEFDYQVQGDRKTANVALELRLDSYGAEKPVLVKEYRAEESINGNDMEDIVAAFNRATLAVYDQFIADMKGTINSEN